MDGVAIVSGGMDSVTLAYHLKETYNDLHLVSVDYGQRHIKELQCAIHCAEALGCTHDVINLQELGKLLSSSGSVLVTPMTTVPEGHYAEESMKATVVPNRNSIMLSIATGIAVAEEASFVALAVHAGDHFIYPDCRPEFVRSFSSTMIFANEGFIKPEFHVWAPFVHLAKADICSLGNLLAVPWTDTWSCYKGGRFHCGKCGTCVERREAFQLAHVKDPTRYEV
jgi:7-cyano-7-deazaguanine synthase